MKRVLLGFSVVPALLVLAACAGPTGPTAAPEPSGSASASPTPSSTATPSADHAGDCTATEGDGSHIPIVYTVYADDATTPITLEYTGFNRDGSLPVLTEEVVGPVITRVGYACVSDVSGAIWTLRATSSTPGALGCTLAFGGRVVASTSVYNEGATTPLTVDCSGNPGR